MLCTTLDNVVSPNRQEVLAMMSRNTTPPGESVDERWARVLQSAARLQSVVPDAVLVGGSASAVHAKHRLSYDHDHVVADLRDRFDEVEHALEELSGWRLGRRRRPVLLLGSIDGVDAGIRQLRRSRPVETMTVDAPGGLVLQVPTPAEMVRIKALLVLRRAAVRDFLDVAALRSAVSPEVAAKAVSRMDEFYEPVVSGHDDVVSEVVSRLAEPIASDDTEPQRVLNHIDGLREEWSSWANVVHSCQQLARDVATRLSAGESRVVED